MTTELFSRPPRQPVPAMPQGEIVLAEPPALGTGQRGGLGNLLMVLPMAAGSGAMALMFVLPGGTGPTTYLMGGLMAASSLGMAGGMFSRGGGDRKQKLRNERRDYVRHLGQVRRQVRDVIDQERKALTWVHPDPGSLWSAAMSQRLWERRITDADFGEARIGIGPQRLAVQLTAPASKPVEDLEPLCASAVRRFMNAYGIVPDLPVSIYLRAFARVLMRGDEEVRRGITRALLAELATFHTPDDLRIAVCASADRQPAWDWVKWLPHVLHPGKRDAAGPVRLITDSFTELEDLMGGEAFRERPRFDPQSGPVNGEPYTVILVDGTQLPEGSQAASTGYRNAVLLDVSGSMPWKPNQASLRLQIASETIEVVGADRTGKDIRTSIGVPGPLSLAKCETLARVISRYRIGASAEAAAPLTTNIELTTLLGLGDARTLDPAMTWKTRSIWDQLRVPIGVGEDGSPIELDIKEAARGGMGPHGILIGATGSGKSELLRTLVLALAVTHSPDTLNFVLTDFKGGATFLGLEDLPHVSAVITNLADELPLVDRMQDSIQSEVTRRQELLRRAGNFSSVHDYEKARAGGAPLDPLPSLLLVVDEFSELLSMKREFIDLFVMIGRVGRSLGVHLLLASQRLDEGRLHSLESHLSYRIGLRTFSAVESRSVLGVVDAYNLPSAPGNGYLRTDTSTLVRFKAAYVSGSYGNEPRTRRQAIIQQQIVPYSSGYIEPKVLNEPEPEVTADESGQSSDTLMSVIVSRLRGQGSPARQVWLPPLGQPPALDELLPAIEPHPEYGLHCADWEGRGELRVPVGVVDRPADQRRDLLMADLSAGSGHVGVVGGSQSGKSTLLRTLICSLALTHTPEEAQFYCLDFGGGTLSSLRGLPHIGSVASRLDAERVTRTLAELSGLLARREQLFREHEIESMAAYRKLRAAGSFADDPYGDVFLVIDGWFTMRQDFEALEPIIQELAVRGLAYGFHLVISAVRWSEVRPWLRDLLGTKFELRLGDHVESEISPRLALTVPQVPGRGLSREAQHFLTALPRIDGGISAAGLADATRALVDEVATSWPGKRAPEVRLLPAVLPVTELPQPSGEGSLRVSFGLDEARLQPVWHDFGQIPHLMIFGDSETGKSNLLRLVARAITQTYDGNQARVMIADTRRGLYDTVPEDSQLGYTVSASALEQNIGEIVSVLRKRVPGPDIQPSRLVLRDWWQGPTLFILVDDYDLLATPMSSPMMALVDLLAQGAEIGLHVIIARNSSGASRAMGDPVLRRLWDLGTPGLLLSTGKDEGPFLGSTMPKRLPAGRAQLVTRRGASLIQTALVVT